MIDLSDLSMGISFGMGTFCLGGFILCSISVIEIHLVRPLEGEEKSRALKAMALPLFVAICFFSLFALEWVKRWGE